MLDVQNLHNSRCFVRCDECMKCFHFTCLDPPVKKTPKRRGYSWHCADCDPTVSTNTLQHGHPTFLWQRATPFTVRWWGIPNRLNCCESCSLYIVYECVCGLHNTTLWTTGWRPMPYRMQPFSYVISIIGRCKKVLCCMCLLLATQSSIHVKIKFSNSSCIKFNQNWFCQLGIFKWVQLEWCELGHLLPL